jgi:hypothetical protein
MTSGHVVAARRQSSQRECDELTRYVRLLLRLTVHLFLSPSFYTRSRRTLSPGLCPPSIISIRLDVGAQVKLARDGTRNCRVIRSQKCVLAAGRFSLPDDDEVGAPTEFSG